MKFTRKKIEKSKPRPTAKSKGFAVFEFLGVLIALALLVAVGFWVVKNVSKNTATKVHTSKPKVQGTQKGVSLSPKSFGAMDFGAFFGEAVKSASVISWAGSWTELERPGSAPYTVAKLSHRYGYQPVIIVGVNDEKSGTLDNQNKQRFIEAVQGFAADTKVPYIGLGNEMNRVQAKSADGYATFKEWFAEASSAIKQKSPGTKVFTTFQYEQLNGLKGGLFGGQNDESSASWQLLGDFPNADLIAFTTYPYIIYSSPTLIPNDYYSRVGSHTDRPVVFTEIGWPSGTEAAGYESSTQEQADFIRRISDLVRPLSAEFVIWPFLYEQNIPKPFSTIGLIDKSGNPKPALAVWQRLDFGK